MNFQLFHIFSILLIAAIFTKIESDNFTVCETKNCREAAALILDGLNPEIDPCDNFYQFVCGRWKITNPLSEGKTCGSRVSVAAQQVERRLLDILEADNRINVTRPVKLMREYYKDCMNLDALDRIGIEPINTIIEKIGDWPLMTNDSGASISWQKLNQHYLNIMGSYSLFNIKVTGDYADWSTNRIRIFPPSFPRADAFPVEVRWTNYSRKESVDSPYRRFIMEIAKIFFQYRNLRYSKKKLNKDVTDMLKFEYKIYRAQRDSGDIFNEHPSIEELQKYYNNSLPISHNGTARINWYHLIKTLFKPTKFSIEQSEEIFMFNWKYISRLGRVLGRTKNHVIVNYIHWNFISEMIPFTNERTRRLLFDVYGEDYIKHRLTRQQECLVECRFTHALYYEYAKEYFSETTKQNVLAMGEAVRKIALKTIWECQWLDQTMKSILYEKVQSMHMLIGYPDWYNDEKLADYYKNLKPGENYFEKTLNYAKFTTLSDLEEFRQPMRQYVWQITPITVNARYSYYYNALIFPMAFVLSPDFSDYLPRAIKYGLDGFVFAHEIFHALDPHGITYDKNWEKMNWSEKALKRYKKRVDCITDQFNCYSLVDIDPVTRNPVWIQLNGTLFENENFVDTAGLQTVFKTFRANSSENDLRLPGLDNYDRDQLFFITFASRWCQIGTADWWQDTYGIRGDHDEGHGPSQLRVNNPLRNFDEFAKAFNCRSWNYMNRQAKCILFS